ncbi:MAG: phage integrase SAM-like domain-containing protein [Alistipes sp.]
MIVRDYKRSDGMRNVRLRVTHNAKIVYLSTNIFVSDNDLSKSLHIKPASSVSKQCEALVRQSYDFCTDIGFALDKMSVQEVVQRLKLKLQGGEVFRLDFIDFGRKESMEMGAGSAKNYRIALNSLVRYIQSETLDISKINTSFLRGYKTYLETEPSQRGKTHSADRAKLAPREKGSRAVSLYLSYIRAIHNLAKKKFNNEDLGVVNIPQSPFANLNVRQPRAKKRAIPIDKIQQIIDLEDVEKIDFKMGKFRRRDLARDCFMLSFALMGMNSADLYSCAPAKGEIIIYNRQKTMTRREDAAEMHVRIEACIKNLVEKYRDKEGERMFCFYKHYKDKDAFNGALNRGLNEIAKIIGLADLTYYAARHSWATIARSSIVGIDKATVHEALNHIDDSMRVTDIYIDRDWSVLWKANEKVIALFDFAPMQKK